MKRLSTITKQKNSFALYKHILSRCPPRAEWFSLHSFSKLLVSCEIRQTNPADLFVQCALYHSSSLSINYLITTYFTFFDPPALAVEKQNLKPYRERHMYKKYLQQFLGVVENFCNLIVWRGTKNSWWAGLSSGQLHVHCMQHDSNLNFRANSSVRRYHTKDYCTAPLFTIVTSAYCTNKHGG